MLCTHSMYECFSSLGKTQGTTFWLLVSKWTITLQPYAQYETSNVTQEEAPAAETSMVLSIVWRFCLLVMLSEWIRAFEFEWWQQNSFAKMLFLLLINKWCHLALGQHFLNYRDPYIILSTSKRLVDSDAGKTTWIKGKIPHIWPYGADTWSS